MSKARDIAMGALAEIEREKRDREEREKCAQRSNQRRNEEAAWARGRVVLERWFPGVTWTILDTTAGPPGTATGFGEGHQLVVRPSNEGLGSKFKLLIDADPRHEYEPYIYGVTLQYDTDTGYSYWSGVRVQSAADVGRFLKAWERLA